MSVTIAVFDHPLDDLPQHVAVFQDRAALLAWAETCEVTPAFTILADTTPQEGDEV